ncbi:MAG TPA: hypothetical protein VMB81_31105 [Candidatus Sulfotelmatobacter sp.]|nr:hypothetical protein [Candidatus Sulfotelmatobacter sp.]
MARQENFELQVFQSDHWVTQGFSNNERDARKQAQGLLANPNYGGVRVVRDVMRAGGKESSVVIFTQMREATKELIRAQPIDEAPMCRVAADLHTVDARNTMQRVLRQYIDKMVLTPTEIMHNHRELKRVLDFEALVPAAVSRVAALQAKEAGEEPAKRNRALFEMINDLHEQARLAAERPNLPELSQSTDLNGVVVRLEKLVGPEQIDFFALVCLSKDLSQTRSWLGKLERLLGLLKDDGNPRSRSLVDRVASDIFGSTNGLRDMLGRQPDLSTALCQLIDIIEGRFTPKGEETPEVTGQLARYLSSRDLVETRLALLRSVKRQLKGSAPLTHGEGEQQRKAYRDVALRLLRNGTILGGGAMADALALGYQRFVEEGGATGRRNATARCASTLDTSADQIRVMLALLEGELGAEHKDEFVGRIDSLIRRADSVNALTTPSLPPRDKMQQTALLHKALVASSLPEPQRAELADRVDTLLANFVEQSKIVERLDDPSASLRLRATRLVQFCASDALTRAKASKIARDRVVAHLRQPNFDQHFVADLTDPAEHTAALKSFYGLLKQAGFE